MRAAASRSRREWGRCSDERAASLRYATCSTCARDSSDEQRRCGRRLGGEAAVLVSRRTAPCATHGLPSELLSDDGYLGPVPAKLMLVSLR